MTLSDYLRFVRRFWYILASGLLVGLIGSVALSAVTPQQYSSTTRLFVSVKSDTNVNDLNVGATYVQQAVKSYAGVVTTPIVLSPVIKSLGLHTTSDQLARSVSASVDDSTVLLDVTVLARSPALAAQIANSIASHLQVVVGNLSLPAAGQTAPVQITQIQAATPMTTAVSPNWVRNVSAGAGIGAVLGVLVSLAISVLSTRLRSVEDIRALVPMPVLGTIPVNESLLASSRMLITNQDEAADEALKVLRTNLRYLNAADGAKCFLITSSMPGEGKTTTAASLALAIAEGGQSTILIDADLRRPRIADATGIDGSVGLTEVLIDAVPLASAIQSWRPSLDILPSGATPPNPSELLGSPPMAAVLNELKTKYQFVLVDSPPVLPVTDSTVLLGSVDNTLLLVGLGKCTSHELVAAVERLSAINDNPLALVVNFVPTKGLDSYGYGAYGAYGNVRLNR